MGQKAGLTATTADLRVDLVPYPKVQTGHCAVSLPLATRCSLLATCYSLLAARCSLLATLYSLLATLYSLFAARYLLLAACWLLTR